MTQPPDRLVAALTDRYRLERHLGAGGMATVWLAEDLKHKRKVALKVLKPELAAVLGAERFVQEITTTAALQHPHILPLFDSGTADGFLYYVMPFIDGETLRDKLNRETQLGVDEALRIATEVGNALDYAHRKGVIHRDIKPENILLHDGRPMVADFGIALAVSAAAGGRMTETGLSLGTPHYMSPEQATAEKEITGRSDVYSLASVLYEMLAGQPPHLGGSAQQIIMKIIAEPVAMVTQYRKAVPAHVAAALAKALEKLPADRFATAREFVDALGNPGFSLATTGTASRAQWTASWKERAAVPLAVAAGLAVVAATWGWSRPATEIPPMQLPMALPDSAPLRPQYGILFALSADASRIVYVGPGGGDVDLYERPLNSLVTARIPDTNGADSPFLSPAGDEVAFYRANPPRLFTVSLRGGPRQTWAQDSTLALGGDYGPDESIYFVRQGGIRRVREPGGAVEEVTSVDASAGELNHAWVDVLPGGKGAIFTVLRRGNAQHDIAAVDLRTGARRILLRGTYARYSPTGHLLYVDAAGGLFAIAFDQGKLATTGAPIPLVSGVGRGDDGVAYLALSETGTMLYSQGAGTASDLVARVDRQGTATNIDTTLSGLVDEIKVSPDGRRLALTVTQSGQSNIWIKELPAGTLQKLSLEGNNWDPSWSADGRTVYYLSQRAGGSSLFSRRADGGANDTLIFSSARPMRTISVSPDGTWAVYTSDADIFARRLQGDTSTITVTATPTTEAGPQLSPDGRWLAYTSFETGSPEVYVSPFPDVTTSRMIVSVGGGNDARWSGDGRELFYVGAPGATQKVAQLDLVPTLRIRERRSLFDRSEYAVLGPGHSYDVTPDGRYLLLVRSRFLGSGRLQLVQNWPAQLLERAAR